MQHGEQTQRNYTGASREPQMEARLPHEMAPAVIRGGAPSMHEIVRTVRDDIPRHVRGDNTTPSVAEEIAALTDRTVGT